MARVRFLLTVTTYPLPSRRYDELVCTAGICEDGSWIRIYPMPLSFLKEQKLKGNVKVRKYTWLELDVVPRANSGKDFRPESYSPVSYDFKDLVYGEHIDTKSNWAERKKWCLKNVYTNLTQLIAESQAPTNKSLATFKPAKIVDFKIESDDREWKESWKANFVQYQLNFDNPEQVIKRNIPRKLPYRFSYVFVDDEGRESTLMIEDWEIEELYFNCLKTYGSESVACQKVKEKYFDTYTTNHDVYLFLGTQFQHHVRRAKNPFVIIGVFAPHKAHKEDPNQLSLF